MCKYMVEWVKLKSMFCVIKGHYPSPDKVHGCEWARALWDKHRPS